MNVLALDTSMGACSAALLRRDETARNIFARAKRMARGHAEALMPMVAEVMSEGGTAFAELDVIAATTGPGSFTGVRIAISAARALALVTEAKLFGIDSLTVMAHQAHELAGSAPFAIAADARRSMIYFGLYDEAARKLDGPRLITPNDAVTLLPNALKSAFGSGANLLAEAARERGLSIEAGLPELEPSAIDLAALASDSGEIVPVLRPLYLRPPDAKPQAQAAIARR
jgi:tRNA threonylcarbamoyladenosine biosynthesis protein TsaB